MSPVTHFFAGWIVANGVRLTRRERAVVTLAGVIPDIDGLGLIADFITRNWTYPLMLYPRFHHTLAHNLLFGLLVAAFGFALAKQRWKTAMLTFLSFHLHLLGDLAGSRGPDGFQWSIAYLQPFTPDLQLTWNGQWELNAWPNFAVTVALLAATFYLAYRRGYSPVEIFSSAADRAFVRAIRNLRRAEVDSAASARLRREERL